MPSPPQATYPPLAHAVQQRTSGLAVASMVLGILWISWIGSILAVVFGHVSLGQIKRSCGALTGRGMAIAGLVLGYIGVATLAAVIAVFASGGSGDHGQTSACSADTSALSTAEEAYHASTDAGNGSYGTMTDLEDAHFIVSASTLHIITLTGGGND